MTEISWDSTRRTVHFAVSLDFLERIFSIGSVIIEADGLFLHTGRICPGIDRTTCYRCVLRQCPLSPLLQSVRTATGPLWQQVGSPTTARLIRFELLIGLQQNSCDSSLRTMLRSWTVGCLGSPWRPQRLREERGLERLAPFWNNLHQDWGPIEHPDPWPTHPNMDHST